LGHSRTIYLEKTVEGEVVEMIREAIGRRPEPAAWSDDRRGALILRWSAALYGVVWVVHTSDHLRRGTGAVTREVLIAGSAAAVMQVIAIGAVFARHRLAPLIAVAIGFPDAIGIAAVHLLPHWSSFSDAFPGAHGTGVTAFSWVAAVAEIAGALAFCAAGVYVTSRR
jgi:hypothetical protein